MAVAAVTGVAVLLVTYLSFPVTGVRVEGARMYTESEAWDAIPERASLLTLNTGMLERKVESNPWVEGARVREDWESGIVAIEVEERRPILDAELDGRRMILASDGRELPRLGGAHLGRVEVDRDQLGEIMEFTKRLNEGGVKLNSVDKVGPRGIEATVEGRRVVFSGAVSEGQVGVLEGVLRRHPDAPVFDLRSPERVVVGGPSNDGADRGSRG